MDDAFERFLDEVCGDATEAERERLRPWLSGWWLATAAYGLVYPHAATGDYAKAIAKRDLDHDLAALLDAAEDR